MRGYGGGAPSGNCQGGGEQERWRETPYDVETTTSEGFERKGCDHPQERFPKELEAQQQRAYALEQCTQEQAVWTHARKAHRHGWTPQLQKISIPFNKLIGHMLSIKDLIG